MKADAGTPRESCRGLKAPSGRIVSCGIYRTDAPGLEVRVGFSDVDLLRSQRTAEISARELAEEWRQAALAKGGFADLAPQPERL